MTRAIAFARQITIEGHDVARALIVAACAVALVAAGQSLPF